MSLCSRVELLHYMVWHSFVLLLLVVDRWCLILLNWFYRLLGEGGNQFISCNPSLNKKKCMWFDCFGQAAPPILNLPAAELQTLPRVIQAQRLEISILISSYRYKTTLSKHQIVVLRGGCARCLGTEHTLPQSLPRCKAARQLAI